MTDFDKINIKDIKPSIYNPRKINNTEYNKLSKSISEFGVISPIIINLKNNHIIGGHQRYDVLYDEYISTGEYSELNLIKVGDIGWAFPSSDLKVEDSSVEKAMNLALNKISGEWDVPKLEMLLIDLDVEEFNLDLTGFDKMDLKELNIDLKTNITLPNPQEELKKELEKEKKEYPKQEPDKNKYTYEKEDNDDNVSIYGEEEITSNEINDNKKDIIDLEDNSIEVTVKRGDLFQLGNHRLLCGDGMSNSDLKILMGDVKADTVFTDPPYDLNEYNYKDTVKEYSKDANIFIMNDDQDAVGYLRESELEFVQFLICNILFTLPKQNRPFIQHIIMTHEINGNAPHYRNLEDGMRSIINMKYRGLLNDDIRIHKHQKSIDFVKTILKHYAVENVLDIFGGSGTTIIACEELNLNCFMTEIEPKYVQGIINRWESYTGKKAVKLN